MQAYQQRLTMETRPKFGISSSSPAAWAERLARDATFQHLIKIGRSLFEPRHHAEAAVRADVVVAFAPSRQRRGGIGRWPALIGPDSSGQSMSGAAAMSILRCRVGDRIREGSGEL